MSLRKLTIGSSALVVALVAGWLVFGSPGSDRAADTSANQAGRVSKEKGSEVTTMPDGSGTEGLPGLDKKKSLKEVSLVRTPLPKTASRRGKLVAGFPVAIVPVVSGSSVQTSGVSSKSKTLQLSIQATNKRSPEKILAFYRSKLAAHGFIESSVPAVGGSTASNFKRNADKLVVTVTKSRSKGTTYSVFGTLHAGKS